MKLIKFLFYFFGSIYFALILITSVAALVIAGTFLESISESHRYALQLTYGSPIFALLLWGFFFNIFLSSVHRWPFKSSHIPFLLTHLGLLMILAGVLIKNYFGVQGQMMIIEGSGNDKILVSESQGVIIEKKQFFNETKKIQTSVSLDSLLKNKSTFPSDVEHFPEIELKLTGYFPHAEQHLGTSVKDDLTIKSLIVYDGGFGGYAVQAAIPFSSDSAAHEHLEKIKLESAATELKQGLTDFSTLSPPLQLLHHACQKVESDFVDCFIEFLDLWNKSRSWLYFDDDLMSASLKKALKAIDWEEIPDRDKKGCAWICRIFTPIEMHLKEGHDFIDILKMEKWPLVHIIEKMKQSEGPCAPDEIDGLMIALAQQIFSVGQFLPHSPSTQTSSARLLSAYLRVHGIHLNYIPFTPPQNEEALTIECPVTLTHTPKPSLQKLEENTPLITLQVHSKEKQELIALHFDRFGTGLKQPALAGQYLLRFQPIVQTLPYRLRLRQARQINYPGTSQPYSYESDLLITDKVSGQTIEKTISMNNVHETWDGYRFYLANVAKLSEDGINSIQIVVNKDPAKYWLTYPGAFILSLGMILLFWLNPYAKKK
jgi:ResB-like family